jgi:uncharacterized protein YkwD
VAAQARSLQCVDGVTVPARLRPTAARLGLTSGPSALALGAVIALLSWPPVTALRAEGTARIVRSDRVGSLLELANAERAKVGVPPLHADTKLMKAAQAQAEQAAAAGRLQHVLPGARYPRPQDRLDAFGYPWRAFAENIAYGHADAAAAIDAWMHSPGHRKNLLSPAYTELGTGFATDSAGRPYDVQVFGRPR